MIDLGNGEYRSKEEINSGLKLQEIINRLVNSPITNDPFGLITEIHKMLNVFIKESKK